jgi:hypothetical protein
MEIGLLLIPKRIENIMKTVYILFYDRELPGGIDDERLLGVYTCHKKAKVAMRRAMRSKSLSRSLEHYVIDEYQIGKDHWESGFFTWSPENG